MYATCVRVPMEIRKALDPLELELQAAARCLTWCWEKNSGPLEEQRVL